jgi:dipeptidyl aminopeptidase/acylaminoacyl peptidase
MFWKHCAAVLAATVLYANPSGAVPPLEAYGRLPTLSDMTLSPDGTMIAYVKGDESNRLLVIQAVGIHEAPTILNVGDMKLRSLQWADNSHLLITTSTTTLPVGLIGHRHDWRMAQEYDLGTKSLHPLLQELPDPANPETTTPTLRMNVIEGIPQPRIVDGHTVVFVYGMFFPGPRQQSRLALFREDLGIRALRMASSEEDQHAEGWIIDEQGRIVAEADYYESEQHWRLKVFSGGDIAKPIDVPAAIEGPNIEGLSEDGTAVVIELPPSEDWPTYEQISLKDGSSAPWQHSDLHLDGLMEDERTGRVIGGPRLTDKSDYIFFDAHADMVWRSIKAAFKDATNVDLISWSQDRTSAVVRVFGADYGDGYFFVDMKTHKADPIGNEYDNIDDVSPVKWIDYAAADGRTIHAYLTLPMSRDPKNLPLIVLPHDGPHDRDRPGFNWFAQALASRGYAILQPEFRGSGGFGHELFSAGFGEFGRKMETDLSDGARALAAQGIIDPKRVCIVGDSLYGGYAALAGASFDTGIYRCAVSEGGVSDLRAQLHFWGWPHNTLDDRRERFWDRFLGISDTDDPKLDDISPIKHVDKVSIPILLIHGKDDTVVPISQSEDMADALKAAGKQVEFVKLEGEDHWLSRSETRLQMLEATVKFLETNNPPDAAQAVAPNSTASK